MWLVLSSSMNTVSFLVRSVATFYWFSYWSGCEWKVAKGKLSTCTSMDRLVPTRLHVIYLFFGTQRLCPTRRDREHKRIQWTHWSRTDCLANPDFIAKFTLQRCVRLQISQSRWRLR